MGPITHARTAFITFSNRAYTTWPNYNYFIWEGIMNMATILFIIFFLFLTYLIIKSADMESSKDEKTQKRGSILFKWTMIIGAVSIILFMIISNFLYMTLKYGLIIF